MDDRFGGERLAIHFAGCAAHLTGAGGRPTPAGRRGVKEFYSRQRMKIERKDGRVLADFLRLIEQHAKASQAADSDGLTGIGRPERPPHS